MKPFITLLGDTPSSITFKRIQEDLLQTALDQLTIASLINEGLPPPRKRKRITAPDYSFLCNHSSAEPKRVADEPGVVKASLLKTVFDQASRSDTRDTSRRKLYAVWKAGMMEMGNVRADYGKNFVD